MLAVNRILFPTDFSEGAKRAFPQAAFMAHWHDAELHLLNVTGRHLYSYEDARDRFPLSTDTLSSWLGEPPNPSADWPDFNELPLVQEQVEASSPAERIVRYVDDEDVDLVVMGTHGRRGVERMLLGSVTEEVVRTAPAPVMTVRTSARVEPNRIVSRILVPVDFSSASKSAIAHAKEIAMTFGAEIDLLHVVQETDYPSAYGLDVADQLRENATANAEDALGKLAHQTIGIEHAVVEATTGYPPTAILEHAEAREADMIVIATHGRTGLDHFILGSVAERVLRQSPVPVFVVKPDKKSLVPAPKAGLAADAES
jgi:nucleotide-binding universal stress UspA family protein